MKHIHELTPQEKNRLCAELDGWEPSVKPDGSVQAGYKIYHKISELKYSTSFDAIIPLRQKLGMMTIIESSITPLMLLDDTLIATGKALA
jgi:hypothetical protein